jgi:hypothetical protein
MAKFLNTGLLSEWIERLIDETERELIILAPYINMSDVIFQKLRDANNRGVETIVVYRENKLHDKMKEKLRGIDNLNLMHHPNLHAKCFYNEKYLIVGSMNLYEFSVKNNREMGILLRRFSDQIDGRYISADEDEVFTDAVDEIRNVIKSAEMEKPSRETTELGFEMDIIKTDAEKTLEMCKKYNKYFINKFFEPSDTEGHYNALCRNYYDKVDVNICGRRISVLFNLPDSHLNTIRREFMMRSYDEFMYPGFKFYWNDNTPTSAYLYFDHKRRDWSSADDTSRYGAVKDALSKFIADLKPMMVIK